MTRSVLSERSSFAFVALAFCLLLSFRPIPHASSGNDTGRYVDYFHDYCSAEIEDRHFTKDTSYKLFYTVTAPACWFKSDKLFLFGVALFTPLGFLLFSKWRKGSFFWSTSLLFSVIGLELMTNAMRQSLGMFLFFGALAFIREHRKKALLLGLVAVTAHISVFAFFPLMIWMVSARLEKKQVIASGAVLFLAGLLSVIIWRMPVLEFMNSIGELKNVYALIYADKLKVLFMLFMVAPLYFVYGARFFCNREYITGDEKKAIIYSSALLLLSYAIFPYIAYRFAIFTSALQVFLITRSEEPGVATGALVLVGLLMHLVFMLAVTNHFKVLIYG